MLPKSPMLFPAVFPKYFCRFEGKTLLDTFLLTAMVCQMSLNYFKLLSEALLTAM